MSAALEALQAVAPNGVTVTLDNRFPGKGWLLEVHGDDEWEDDAKDLAAVQFIERFVALGNAHLGDPSVPPCRDLRVRMQGHNSHWAVFEFNSLPEDEREAGILRLAAALAAPA